MEKEKNGLGVILAAVLVLAALSLIYHFKSEVSYLRSASQKIAEARAVKIAFTGDIMLDRIVRKRIDASGLPKMLEGIKPIFENQDAVVGNLEGVVSDFPSVSLKDYNRLKFTFATTTLPELKKIGFTGFSLANNHSLDFGSDGYAQTQANLKENGLYFFGSPLNDQFLSTKVHLKNENVCFVGFHSLYDPSDKTVIEEIGRIKTECTFIVVFTHWGEEYSKIQNENQTAYAHKFIDAGADLVIGAHPHVIEPLEIYKNRAIFYSLGNFVFDQTFSVGTRQGLVVTLELTPDKAKYKLIGTEMNDFVLRVTPLSNLDSASALKPEFALPR